MSTFVHDVQQDLAQLAAAGADARQIAGHAMGMWNEIEAALAPIIGQRGVAALFKRSLLLSCGVHASLASVLDDPEAPGSLAALRARLEQQTVAEAVATHGAVLQVFLDLLVNLIGESLTDRLLHPVREGPPGGAAAREQSS